MLLVLTARIGIDEQMRIQLATIVSLLVMTCDATQTCSGEQLTPIAVNRVISVRVAGSPMRRYEPLMIGDAFGRDRIREIYAFFPELASLDSAKGIAPIAKARMNRVVLQLKSKVDGSFDFELHVLEGGSVWTCCGKYFSMKRGWADFLAKEFARQEKDRREHGHPKILHVDEDNAAANEFRVKIASGLNDEYKRVSVTLSAELATSFQHAGLSYLSDGEFLLSGTARSRKLEDGQLQVVFNVAPKIAKDVRFTIQITRKPRPLVYRFELPSFLGNKTEQK